jgi:hypothetical protein
MTTPATCANKDLYRARSWPTSVEIAPKVMNTTLKPKMKAAEFSISFRSTRSRWDFSSSTPAPEMSDTYPGTSGRTQGDRKEISPAKNAAMGRGKLVIVFSQSCAVTCACTRNCAA